MLAVKDLIVSVGPDSDPIDIVSGVSFAIGKGEVLGLVGESGCGKSMTSLAIMGLLPEPGPRVRAGRSSSTASTSRRRRHGNASKAATATSR